jgi:hypothetical protein
LFFEDIETASFSATDGLWEGEKVVDIKIKQSQQL